MEGARAWRVSVAGGMAVLAVLFISWAYAHDQSSGKSPSPREVEIRAAFIYNFMRFTEWPADSGKAGPGAWIIGVVRDSTLEHTLAHQLEGMTLRGRPLRTRPVTEVRDVFPTDVLVMGAQEQGEVRALLAEVGSRPVLTVGSAEEFCRGGGQIRLFLEEDRMRFEVNVDAVRRSGFTISSKMLGLAKIYREARSKR